MSWLVVMPKLGLTMEEGEIETWHKSEGEEIKKGEVLFDVTTDKLTNEVEAKEGGVLRKVFAQEGDTVKCLEPVAIVAGIDEDISGLLEQAGVGEVKSEVPVSDKKVEFKTSPSKDHKKVVVIGGGPGGYIAAIRAAQLGAEVTVVEKGPLGGTCLNVGCIPTKVLLHSAEVFTEVKNSSDLGIDINGQVTVNWQNLQKRKGKVVKKLVSGVGGLLAFNKVKVVKGSAKLQSRNSLSVTAENGQTQAIGFDNAIIATGSLPFIPPIPGTDLDGVIDSTGALSLNSIPDSLAIIGGGVIGIEFANIFNSLGCKVTIVEMLPYILPPIDREISELVRSKLAKEGITINSGCKVAKIENSKNGLKVNFVKGSENLSVEAEKVLVAIGRYANIEGLNAEGIGIKTERGKISVDNSMKTNLGNVYAIGDCTGKNMLAHVASEQGVVAAENIMGQNSKMDYKTVPACVYTKPEIAAVGITEEQAKEKGIDYKVGKFPLSANGKSMIMNETDGVVKIIASKEYDEVLGIHIFGPRATDLITEAALALRLEATVDEIVTTIHAHPTVGEAIKEAALAVDNRALNMVNNPVGNTEQKVHS
ncbi:dihydrolipoyl dehydrogenase [Clostridium tyrobutyricum]|uniref:dihydrolipoyl dehydrogenase n=1 Tax=Clostridium tyrobutyricum TaxID=1519 RepID=UPI00073D3C54|nr:dihydrolipoyl dehydrogenase [Clostridium tyrobutyricum]MBV4446368.1 dihydrolipoyl dehydrogenase [Clostridium tyrobutyricum]